MNLTCHIEMIEGQTMLILKDDTGRMVDAVAVDDIYADGERMTYGCVGMQTKPSFHLGWITLTEGVDNGDKS